MYEKDLVKINAKIKKMQSDKNDLEEIKKELEKEIQLLDEDFIKEIEKYTIKGNNNWRGKKADGAEAKHVEIKSQKNKYAEEADQLLSDIENAIKNIRKKMIEEELEKNMFIKLSGKVLEIEKR